MTKTFLGQKKSMWIQPSGSKLVPWWDGSGNVNNENIEGPVFVLEDPEIIQWFLGKKNCQNMNNKSQNVEKHHTVFVWLLNMCCCYWVAFPRFFWTIIHQKLRTKQTPHESRHLNNHNLIELCAQLAKTHDLRAEVDGATTTPETWSCIDESPYIKMYMHIYYYVCVYIYI